VDYIFLEVKDGEIAENKFAEQKPAEYTLELEELYHQLDEVE